MVVNYLKALPSVMAWIFLSSATMSSISCNSYMGPRGEISRKLFCCHLFHYISFPSQPFQHLLSFFYSSNLYQPPGKFIKESFNQRFETTSGVDSQPTLVILDRSKTQPEESLRECQPGQSHISIHPSPLQNMLIFAKKMTPKNL